MYDILKYIIGNSGFLFLVFVFILCITNNIKDYIEDMMARR